MGGPGTPPVVIRPEAAADADQVRFVNERAFGGPDEAAIVDVLRGSAGAISLVALIDDRVVGHILFTPVQVDGPGLATTGVGLAPMAVLPEYQRREIGARLVRAGLNACRSAGHGFVVVVGHPGYYPRFGFVPASTRGLGWEHAAPPGAFMVLELEPGTLDRAHGVVRFRAEFGGG